MLSLLDINGTMLNSGFDMQNIATLAAKALVVICLIMAVLFLFLLATAFLVYKSLKTGFSRNSLRSALRHFLSGFFYQITFFMMLAFSIVAWSFDRSYSIGLILIVGLSISIVSGLVISVLLGNLFNSFLARISIFRQVSSFLHKLILLIDSYLKK